MTVPLPEPEVGLGVHRWAYSADQMRAYGEACAAAERERLRAELAEQKEWKPRKFAVCRVHGPERRNSWGCPDCVSELRAALAEPTQDVAAAVAAERERIINALPGGDCVDPQWVADMVRGDEPSTTG